MEVPDTATADVPAASSPAPRGQDVLNSMTAEQRSQWELTGNLPTDAASSPALTTESDSSSATPAAQAAATAATETPASEPGKPVETRNAESRIRELANADRRQREEIARLQGQLEALTRGKPDVRPESSPAPTQREYQRYLAMPDAPKEADFDTYAEFSAAQSLFITDQRWQEHQARADARTAHARQIDGVKQLGQTAEQRIQAALTADPDFRSKVHDDLLAVEPASIRALAGKPIGPQHALAEEILRSEHTAQLLEHFSTDDGRKDWARLCALPAPDFLRAFGRLDARFDRGPVTETHAETPAPKTLSTAPKPVTTIGTKPQESLDPVEASLQRKDFTGYAAAQNARDVAALTGR